MSEQSNKKGLPFDVNQSNTMDANTQSDDDAVEKLMQYLAEAGAGDDDDHDDDHDDQHSAVVMDADDYHNKSVDYAARDQYGQALMICREGLEHWPGNIDLLADVVEYAGKIGDTDMADEHVQLLKAIPRRAWTWRAFVFMFNYLLAKPKIDVRACRQIISDFKTHQPFNENAYLLEAELEEKLGSEQRAVEVLTDALASMPNAQRCALRLADLQMERGLYADVIRTCDYGLVASCAIRQHINTSYLQLLKTLAMDALLHQAENVTEDEVEAVIQSYDGLEDLFPELYKRYSKVITNRRKILRFMRPVPKA